MASGQLVYHIYEQFCHCAVCLKPFSEPKSLPCLHRFCKECLSPLFETLNAGDIFYCPLCRTELTVTEGGVENIRSDFLVSELTKVIQVQKTLQSQNQIRRCEGCNKEEESVGFCSKCGGFLCHNCFTLHQTLKTAMLKDHQPVIDLKDVFAGKVKIGLEKLSQFTKAPKCQNHPENILRLSCVTCEGQQICIACTYEDHVEHKAESIRNMAGKYRDNLQKKLDELKVMVANWESKSEKLITIKEKLSSAVEEVTEKVKNITKDKLEQLKIEQESLTLSTETKVSEIEKGSAVEKTRLENEKNEKIKEIERHYNELLNEHNIDMNNNIEKVRQEKNQRSNEIEKQITHLKAHCDEILNAVSKQLHNQKLGLDGLMSDLSNIQKRFENFITTGSSVMSLANDWSAVENIPSLSFAFDGIKDDIEKIKATFGKFENESNLPIVQVIPSKKLEEVGFINRHKYLELLRLEKDHRFSMKYVDQIVFLEAGCFAMSGYLAKVHYTGVVKTTMTDSKHEYLKYFNDCTEESQYCLICKIDETMIAAGCDKTLVTINVKEPLNNEIKMEGEGCLTRICTDQILKRILTHQANNDIVKVFDLNLNLVKTRKLPLSSSAVCMMVQDDKLIIGLSKTKDDEIYVLNEKDEILSVIPSPGLQKGEGKVWNCWELCSSADGTLYALWDTAGDSATADSGHTVVYTPTYYPLEMIRTNTGASCIAVMEVDGTKAVVAASVETLYICNMW